MTADMEKKKIYEITNVIESFGLYQIKEYILLCLPCVITSMMCVNFVFVAGEMDFRCRIDECEDANSTAQLPSWWPDTNIDKCSKPVLKAGGEQCTNTSFTGQLATCDKWIYESNNTVFAALNLACQPWKVNIFGTIRNLGMLVSVVGSGWIADKLGRKPTLIICMVGASIGSFRTLVTSYNLYIFIEFLEAALQGGSFTAASILALEISSQKHRVLSGVMISMSEYLGECMLACIAIFVPYWKTLVHIITLPCLLFLPYIFLINESPRWLIVNGRVDKAKKAIRRIADFNKVEINNEELANIDEATLKEKFKVKTQEVKEGFSRIFTSRKIIKRFIVVAIIRFSCCLVYYGILYNSVFLPGNKYLNFLLSSIMSFPGELFSLYLMNKFGRKIPLMYGYSLCGILCIIAAMTPARYIWIQLSLVLISKLLIAACFTGAIIYTMELFPTSVRGTLLGAVDFASRTGGMLAAITPLLKTISEGLPFLFFGCSAVLAGVFLILTPETKGVPLFDTIDQLESYDEVIVAKEKYISKTEGSVETVAGNA